jgi:hypothetical protein
MKTQNNNLLIHKVPLEDLINTLIRVYNDGCLFIDIVGKSGEKQDYIGIQVYDEYYRQEESKELNDEDINLLIQ